PGQRRLRLALSALPRSQSGPRSRGLHPRHSKPRRLVHVFLRAAEPGWFQRLLPRPPWLRSERERPRRHAEFPPPARRSGRVPGHPLSPSPRHAVRSRLPRRHLLGRQAGGGVATASPRAGARFGAGLPWFFPACTAAVDAALGYSLVETRVARAA